MSTVRVRCIVEDVGAAIPFYEQFGFGVRMRPAPGFAALVRDEVQLLLSQPGSGGAGQEMPDGNKPEPGGWNRIQLVVDDLEATVNELQRNGIALRNDIVVGKGGKQTLAQDPSGNLVELFAGGTSGVVAAISGPQLKGLPDGDGRTDTPHTRSNPFGAS